MVNIEFRIVVISWWGEEGDEIGGYKGSKKVVGNILFLTVSDRYVSVRFIVILYTFHINPLYVSKN